MGLKDRLASRKRPSIQYALRLDDDTIPRRELAAALESGDEARISVTREKVEACYEQVTIVALPPAPPVDADPDDDTTYWETLIRAHPPTDEQRAQDRLAMFNKATFIPALLAACVQSDPPVTAQEWAEYITTGCMTPGEADDLIGKVWNLNYRVPDPNIPKG